MISYIKLRNFKSFSDVFFDLRGAHKIPKKIAFIYGENGAGKSNLIESLFFLSQTLETFENSQKRIELFSRIEDLTDSKEKRAKRDVIQRFLEANAEMIPTLKESIDKSISLQLKGNMVTTYGFYLGEHEGNYEMEFNSDGIVREELKYIINKRNGTVFSIDKDKVFLSPMIFQDNIYVAELEENIDKYWGKHTFLGIIKNEMESKNEKYIETRINKNLLFIINWLRKISVSYKSANSEKGRLAIPFTFLKHLDQGSIKETEVKELKTFEKTLNIFFTNLYSDIKSVKYDLEKRGNKTKYTLHFNKLINGRIVKIPISLESTGTKNLLDVFPFIFLSVYGSTVVVDEVDTGIHDLLMKEIFSSLSDSIEGQFIATTHNTLLLDNLSYENVYIIKINAEGQREINCVAEYGQRIQKTNSMRAKYLKGNYDGIPNVVDIDMKDLVDDVCSALKIGEP